jgi:hypothetical protein
MTSGKSSNHLAAVVLAIAFVLLVSLSPLVFRWTTSPPTRSETAPATAAKSVVHWQAIAEPHLQMCHQRVSESAARHLEPIVEQLNRARNGTAAFSKIALGLGSKWRLMADAIPGTKGGRNETYLKKAFEQHVLRGDALEAAIVQSITSFLQEMRSHEGEMLVNLRADLQDFPYVDWSTWRDETILNQRFDAAINTVIRASEADFRQAVGSQLVSLIAGELAAQVAVRMGVSAGILGAGAASGWATLGVGVVAGLIIDQIVTRVWYWISNPEHDLTREIQSQIDSLQKHICHGDQQSPGLIQRFLDLAKEREPIRRDALRELFR